MGTRSTSMPDGAAARTFSSGIEAATNCLVEAATTFFGVAKTVIGWRAWQGRTNSMAAAAPIFSLPTWIHDTHIQMRKAKAKELSRFLRQQNSQMDILGMSAKETRLMIQSTSSWFRVTRLFQIAAIPTIMSMTRLSFGILARTNCELTTEVLVSRKAPGSKYSKIAFPTLMAETCRKLLRTMHSPKRK